MNNVLEALIAGRDLAEAEAGALLEALADPNGSPAWAGAVLTALRVKGETAEEVRGFATAMRRLARRPDLDATGAVDVVGTGGDRSGSINLSTASALLTAACGQPVVKHGNRSISSRSGSADVLEALGLSMPLDERTAAHCLGHCGFTFLFAPYYHPAMKAIAGVRRALRTRTIFNILGPLTNPAAPRFYLIGAFDAEVAELMAHALSGLPIERAFVVHGTNGWDEPTPVGPYLLFDVRPRDVRRTERDPRNHGLPRCRPEDLAGGEADGNATRIRRVFDGMRGPDRDAIVLGAGLALEVSGQVPDLDTGIERADAALDGGAGRRLLDRLTALGGTGVLQPHG